MNISNPKWQLLSIAVGILLCFVVVWQQTAITGDFSPATGKTARGFIGDYLKMAYDEGRGADAAELYFAKDAIDNAPNAIDRQNGTPIPHEIEDIIVDGMTVAVHHKIAATRGAPEMDVVDIYKAGRFSRISERRRIALVLDDSDADSTPEKSDEKAEAAN